MVMSGVRLIIKPKFWFSIVVIYIICASQGMVCEMNPKTFAYVYIFNGRMKERIKEREREGQCESARERKTIFKSDYSAYC